MITVSQGTTKTFTALEDGTVFRVVANGGAIGYISGVQAAQIDQGSFNRAFGPLLAGQRITVYMQVGSAFVECYDLDVSGVPITSDAVGAADAASSGVLASTGLVTNSCPTFYYFGSSSTARSYDSTTGLTAWGYISRFHHKCNGGAVFAGASGIASQDSAAQLARLPGVIAALTTRPKFFVLQIAGNDIVGSTAIATVKSNILAMVQLVKDAGMVPVLMTPNTLGGLTADQILRHAAIAEYMRYLHFSDRTIRLADVSRWTGDTTATSYAAISGVLLADNLHLTNYGAWLAGEALYEGLQADVNGYTLGAATPGLLYDATANPNGNLIANPFLTGTTGTGGAWVTSGSVPTGMTLNRTAGTGTVAISTVARTDRPGNWLRLTFTMQANDVYSIFMRPSNTSLPVNTTLYGMSETQVDTTSAGANVKRISLRMRDIGNTQTFWDGYTPSGTASDHTEPVHASRPRFYRVPNGTFTSYGNGSLSHDLEFKGTGTLVFDIGAMGLYAV